MRKMVLHNHHQPQPQFSDFIGTIYDVEEEIEVMVPCITFQVTEDCNLRCTYCYQINKSCHSMDFETAKQAIDVILTDERYFGKTIGVELDFIGGEPLIEIDLIRDTYEYFLNRCIELNHPWLLVHRVSICSNGVPYFNPKVLDFMEKYGGNVSFSITVDGTKELHDTCRIFPDGSGSYDAAMKAVNYHRQHFGPVGSKITISPENVKYTCNAILNMFDNGYESVSANCVFEKGWKLEHATELYYQLKQLANIMYERNMYNNYDTTLFTEQMFCPKDYTNTEDNQNWCGGTGKMLAVDYRGLFYPCLRYMPSSLGDSVEPLIVGNIKDGLCSYDCEKCLKQYLDDITATSQSTEECINCPIANGCAWCSAYNYQETGDVNKRVTYICEMHKARALANVYYWNRFYEKYGIKNYYENYVPDEWAIKIIGKKELNFLKRLINEQKERSEN